MKVTVGKRETLQSSYVDKGRIYKLTSGVCDDRFECGGAQRYCSCSASATQKIAMIWRISSAANLGLECSKMAVRDSSRWQTRTSDSLAHVEAESSKPYKVLDSVNSARVIVRSLRRLFDIFLKVPHVLINEAGAQLMDDFCLRLEGVGVFQQ